jgi:heme exporter protein A
MLSAHDLAARRGNARLFSGLSFLLPAGQALVVSGANGSGKTTLLRVLAGLCTPHKGDLRWASNPDRPYAAGIRAFVTYVGHAPALKDELTAGENLTLLTELSGDKVAPTAIAAALDAVALGGRTKLPSRALSQGQRRRIGLARLALSRRPLWLLDEPATALDAQGSELLNRLVRDHLIAGGAAAIATHLPLGLPEARVQALSLD